jgi:membrane protein DedA with SNARE-associated domain
MAEQFLSIINDFGYLGIFLLMTLESTVFPIPSELVMIPAGYLAFKGDMNPYLAIFAGTLGSVMGAMINYTVSRKWGREFLVRNGKYLLLNEQKLHKMDIFFAKYGEIGTFLGRLLPVVRHYISIPAGLTSMNVTKFIWGRYLDGGSCLAWIFSR